MEDIDCDPYFKLNETDDKENSEIVSQYVFSVIDFSSQYGNDKSISYNASNVVGETSVYPKFGDSPQTFLMQTYGPWSNMLPSSAFVKFNTVLPVGSSHYSKDFIELKFAERVYPTQIDIFETYNGGAVIKIFGFCHETKKWVILWKDEPTPVDVNQSHIFSPPLKPVTFKTNSIRLEFYHEHLQYYYAVDAILLHGTSDCPFENSTPCSPFNFISKFLNLSTSSENAEIEPTFGQCDFEKLPNEIMHLILSFLDLRSLCAASQVSKFFKKLCHDPTLFKCLDLQPYWEKVDDQVLDNLQPRCSSVQNLNLSWCGSRHKILPMPFIGFLERCSQFLTCLKLSNCPFVNNLVIKSIAKSCEHLQVLELRSCRNQELNHMGFSQIYLLKNLVYLDLYHTAIDKFALAVIIKSCSKLEHLLLGCCSNISNHNEVVRDIAKYLCNLKTLDLWRARSLTEAGVFMLAEQCQELVEVDLGWCIQINANSGCIRQLVQNAPKLKKLTLTAIRTISNDDMVTISHYSHELEQLDILGTTDVNWRSVRSVLQECRNLKLLDISFCYDVNEHEYEVLQQIFPSIQIKRLLPSGD